MAQEAFITLQPIPKSLLQKPNTATACPTRPLNHTRRAVLLMLATIPLPVRADRTGKYSTKLTAKRRYLPRIARGVELIRVATDGAQLDEQAMNDLFTAMELFATTYFSEGNRVGEKEKALSMFVADGKKAFSSAKKGGDIAVLVACVNAFVKEAGLRELASIEPI